MSAAVPAQAERQRAGRRGEILAATVRIIGSRGLGAVTHRAVAREAGVPLAATTYYFSSKDELLREALRLLAEDEIVRIGERTAELGDDLGSPDRAAAALAQVLLGDGAVAQALLAKFELYLEAARDPALRATASHWRGAFIALAESALQTVGAPQPERRAQLLVAAIDGALVHELASGIESGGERRLRERLERLFELMLR
ncbi:MAG TPA: TetR family transcriptional regulator [Solirubrobacterales bacterium]|nr:TetR family transcriptional regulator [Solirubrobacterales bacterium]